MTTTMLLDTDRALVQAATAVAKLRCRSANHTVAAAARTADGRVFTGVDLLHPTGGPCAEIVVLGTAATQGVGKLEAIVAVGDRGRGVVPPCGRCRQVLLDYHPGIRVIVGPLDALRKLPVADLLPERDTWADQRLDASAIVRTGQWPMPTVPTSRPASED
ncbi:MULTISPECIES: cytidine deaminase family protein [Micromonospora]|uniref:Cytidine deaminase n=1 Tax=Micromonospora rifamycinica TaxID=291594 RepID=A0A109IG10_9ACTN|nr:MULTISPECIES: cytidine deaminase [Micromonospora]KWV29880.1 cytidine deaminase [Micromonospora rifamycinica]WFE64942.1 cytidine deaminase [Micromonospora sp. WMMD714]SCG49748.1 cytidine deaminase [Micromonospora rifamycinica]